MPNCASHYSKTLLDLLSLTLQNGHIGWYCELQDQAPLSFSSIIRGTHGCHVKAYAQIEKVLYGLERNLESLGFGAGLDRKRKASSDIRGERTIPSAGGRRLGRVQKG